MKEKEYGAQAGTLFVVLVMNGMPTEDAVEFLDTFGDSPITPTSMREVGSWLEDRKVRLVR